MLDSQYEDVLKTRLHQGKLALVTLTPPLTPPSPSEPTSPIMANLDEIAEEP